MKRMMINQLSRRAALLSLAFLSFGSVACEDMGKVSAKKAKPHIEFLITSAVRDVSEVRKGMPPASKILSTVFQEAAPEIPAATDVREALLDVRSSNNDLDSAKSTFMLIAAADGTILRNNLEQDDMAGKNLFQVYPSAKTAKKKGGYYEFTGSWDVARGVNGRDDAQWVAVSPIEVADKEVGLFVAGWSWSSYAYRLEMSLRSEILGNTIEGHKVPLLYVYVLVGDSSYGTPVAPVINGKKLLGLKPLIKTKDQKIWTGPLEIERRAFGVAFGRVPELGKDVVIAVLRSET